jgi:CSLREA domain-containing protein
MASRTQTRSLFPPRSQASLKLRRRRRLSLEILEERVMLSNLVVINLNDSGPGSLRDMIGQADAAPNSTNQVLFQSGLTGTISLTSELHITSSMTVTYSDGATGTLTINAQGASRVLEVDSSAQVVFGAPDASEQTVTLTGGKGTSGGAILNSGNLTLVGCIITGNSASFEGGGIYNAGTLSLEATTVTANSATGGGGGITNLSTGTLTQIQGAITGNQAGSGVNPGDGGGIENSGTASLYSVTIASNKATTVGAGISNSGTLTLYGGSVSTNQAAHSGGGIYNGRVAGSANLIVTTDDSGPLPDCSISGNTATEFGGGLFNAGNGNASLTSATIINNAAAGGGGIYDVAGGTISTASCTISINSAADGAGIESLGPITLGSTVVSSNVATGDGGGIQTTGTLTLNASTVSGNKAGGDGGGIQATAALNLSSCTVSNNNAGGNGGGIQALVTLSLTDSTVSGNTSADNGGGIDNRGTATLTRDTVTLNTSNNGGGIFSSNTLNLTDTTVSKNKGGGISILGTATLTGADITANTGNLSGGILNQGILTLSGGSISQNYASAKGGGITNYGTVTFNDVTISGNSARIDGGGIYSKNALTLTGCTVSGNNAMGRGGGIRVLGDLTLTDSTVSDNTAQSDGGGIYSPSADVTLTLTGCTVSGNASTKSDGGGMYARGNLTLIECTFSDNSATYGGAVVSRGSMTAIGCTLKSSSSGGAIQTFGTATFTNCAVSGNSGVGIKNSGTATLWNCTVANNTAADGGGISNSGTVSLTDCTVANNTATSGGGGGLFSTGTLTMTNCTVSGNTADIGGGILNRGGTLALTNCTLYGNASSFGGGGISTFGYDSSKVTLTNCTLYGNKSTRTPGGGIYSFTGTFTLNNTIVAGNVLGGDIIGPTAVSGSNNLIGNSASAGGLKNGVNGNQVGVNPGLGALGFWGGPTETMLLVPNSPAVDKGDSALIPPAIATDQRGVPRENGAAVDIGAVESGVATLVVTTLADENDSTIDPAYGAGTSFREAIAFASADPYGDTITFNAGLAGTIALTAVPLPVLARDMTIVGPGAQLMTIDAQAAGGSILTIQSGVNASVSGLTLAHGNASAGGAILNHGNLSLFDCALSANSADFAGGGIFNSGTLSVTDCTVSGNTGLFGAGLYNTGDLSLTGSTLSGNTAQRYGGGVYNRGTLTVADTTLAGNSAGVSGGGIANAVATLTVNDSTLAGNSAAGQGGGIWTLAAAALLNNTIVAGSPSGGDIVGPVTGGHNIVQDAANDGGLINGVNGNLVGVDPKLGPLGFHGGLTQTMILLTGSPAINAGDNALIPVGAGADQRGAPRTNDTTVDIGAVESGAFRIVVNTLADEDDREGPALGAGTSLREAITFANTDPYGDTIGFAAGLVGTLSLTLGALPKISGNMAIVGPGANVLTIDGQGAAGSSILTINAGGTAIVSRLTLAGGSAIVGGAIHNQGNLSLTDCTISGNTASNIGGGIYNSGTLIASGTTISGNSSSRDGGGIWSAGVLSLTNCTLSNNSAYTGGAILNIGGKVGLADCTVSGNSATDGGGIYNFNGTAILENTIVADNPAGGDIKGHVTGGHNLIGDPANAGGLINGVGGNLVGVDPLLGPLGFHGGPTPTMALLPGSPALNAGDDALIPAFIVADQRGAPRVTGSNVDIGAFEGGALSIVVTTLADEDDSSINPFIGAGTSLREALGFATADPDGDTISFAALVKGAINLSAGPLPAISTNLTIDGPGAGLLTIDGQGKGPILDILPGATVTVSGVTLTHGNAAALGLQGGAIANQGTLSLSNSTISGNSAGDGGGIVNVGTLTLTDCTVSGNTAFKGGGIANEGPLTIINSTIANNSASYGGGIYELGYTAIVANSTLAGNSASNQGGGIDNSAGGSVTLNNTIVAGNPTGGDINGPVTGAHNLVGAAASAGGLVNGVGGNLVGVDPKLGPLGFYGGPTRTIALLSGSPAIGTGGAFTVTTDQRGFALDSPNPDIGAYQYQGAPPSLTFSGPTTAVAQVQVNFTLTATTPNPADQNGTFTYTIDWNGDGTGVQVVEGAGSLAVMHAFSAAGSYTPTVTVLDQQHRASSTTVLAGPVVVTALTSSTIPIGLIEPTILVTTSQEAILSLAALNGVPAASWQNAVPVNMVVTAAPVQDVTINPTSPSAQIDVSGMPGDPLSLSTAVNVSNPFGGTSYKTEAIVALVVAGAVVGGAVGGTALTSTVVELAPEILSDIGEVAGEEVVSLGFDTGINIVYTGMVEAGLVSGVAAGGAAAVFSGAGYYAVGASPALVVDQGRVTWSDALMGTMTNSCTIVVNGGTLNLKHNWIEGNLDGSQPIIEVDGGTLILGADDGTNGNQLAASGRAPFLNVTGTGMVIVQGGNTFDQITGDLSSGLTALDSGTTITQLVSSAPIAVPGEMVTYTATVTGSSNGSVEFFDSTTQTFLGSVPVGNGSASLAVTLNALTAGDTIYATYLPTTGALAPSSGHLMQVVANATTTTLTGPATTPSYGQLTAFTATISNTTSSAMPTGSVEFYDGSADLGPGSALSGSGSAATSTFTTSSLTAATHTIRAVYAPASVFEGSFATLSQAVNRATPLITWSTAAGITFGTTLSGTQLNAAAANSASGAGVAGTFKYTPGAGTVLHAGSNQALSVSFTPNDMTNYTTASGSTAINVAQKATTITLVASTPQGAPGQSVTFTATVAGGLAPPYLPTGSVQFQVNGVNAGSPVPLSAGDTAVFSTIEPASGSFKVTAVYSGDSDFRGIASPAFTESVFSPGVFVLGTTLFVVGADTSDYALITPWGSKLNGSGGLAILASLNGGLIAKAFTQTFNAIDVFGYGGNDNFQLFPTLTLPTTVVEGNGNNNLLLANGNDTVTLGSGNNVVLGGDGDDDVTVGNGNDIIQLGNGSDVIIEGNGNDYVSAGNGADLVVGGLGQHTIQLGNGNDIVIDGTATVVNSGDSFRQVLVDWNAGSAASVNTRLKVVYNTSHPSVLKAGHGRDWWFFTYPKVVTNKKSTDRLN